MMLATIIVCLVIGFCAGTLVTGFVLSVLNKAEIEEAYTKGREDERGRILEEVENMFGGNDNG